MNKAYPRYLSRHVESLEDLWDFHFEEGKSIDQVSPESLACAARLHVPGAFDAAPAYLGKRGTGVYRRTLRIEPGRVAMLEFEAVSFAARVLVDGECLAEHFCGYSPFQVTVPASDRAVRELVVLAENRFDFERIPMHEHYFDFYQFGGIIRPVWLHHLPKEHIVDVRVDAADYRGGTVEIRGRVAGAGEITVSVLDTDLAPVKGVADSRGDFRLRLTVPAPRAWSPSSPSLYRLRVQFGADDSVVRFGFREIKAVGAQLFLNGEPLRLFGYNRHEYFPNFGPSTPFAQMVHDVQLLKDCGCNFVRGSHYHQDQRFLDLCDEMGLVVWEENLGWGQNCKQLEHALYQAHHHAALEEMVARSYNHPSILIWGFLNEAATDQDCFRPIFEKSMRFLRAEGGNRLVAYASNRIERDRYFEEVDIVCINFYPGWYGAEDHPDPVSMIVPHIAGFVAHLEKRGLAEKPLLLSEIGCEALYGWRDQQRDFHSEEYQLDYLRTVCREAVDNPRLLGVCLWHFSDARTYSGGRALGRPRAFNNKGTFDEYRRPKLARDAIRAIFRETLNQETAALTADGADGRRYRGAEDLERRTKRLGGAA
jgi:beta-glucuronidase